MARGKEAQARESTTTDADGACDPVLPAELHVQSWERPEVLGYGVAVGAVEAGEEPDHARLDRDPKDDRVGETRMPERLAH